jgi:hypothetical protein
MANGEWVLELVTKVVQFIVEFESCKNLHVNSIWECPWNK